MKINVKNEAQLNAAIVAAENGARERLANAYQIQLACEDLERRLARILPKKAWQGLRFIVNVNAQSFPSAYRYTPKSTIVLVERGAKDWFVLDVRRDRCAAHKINAINLQARKSEIAEFVLRNF